MYSSKGRCTTASLKEMKLSPNLGMYIPAVTVVDTFFITRYAMRDPDYETLLQVVDGWHSVRWLNGRKGVVTWCDESFGDNWDFIIDRFFFKNEEDVSLFLLMWGQYVD